MNSPLLVIAVVSLYVTSHVTASTEGIKKGFGTIKKDTIDASIEMVSGTIPNWIRGMFVHQSCGAFGDIENPSRTSRVTHLFDCIASGQSFKFQNGEVTFTNRYYKTVTADVFNTYNRDMNASKVYWTTVFADIDITAKAKHAADFAKVTATYPEEVPHVAFWNVGNKAISYSETPEGVQLDVHSMEVMQVFPYKDGTFGMDPNTHVFSGNPAHETMDADGTVWSNVMAFHLPTMDQWRLVYKIVEDTRIVVAKIPYPRLDLSQCGAMGVYPDTKAKQGYMHSFAATPNYVILPETSYLFEPCKFFTYQAQTPFYKTVYYFNNTAASLLRVVRKSDGQVMNVIELEAFFVTHQLNAYEENGQIIMDMMVYSDAGIYTKCTYVDEAVKGHNGSCQSFLRRFVIDMNTWTLVSSENILPNAMFMEMPHVRSDYMAMKYQFVYITQNIFVNAPQILHKINVQTKQVMASYNFAEDLFPQEPWFLPTPGSQSEDDGVLLVNGFDGKQGRGFLLILDAKTMTEVSYSLAPDMIQFGLHVRFFNMDTERKYDGPVLSAATTTQYPSLLPLFSLLLMCFLHQL